MIEFSNGAKKALENYLRQVRVYLRWSRSVDADEVEQNIKEHVENEFADATAAVSVEQLDAVLQRLGGPRQWVPEEELPWWRKIILRLSTGPEDWRLAYISFGLLLSGFLFFIYSGLLFIIIGASFIISRAALAAASDHKELGAQKWLIYPSLVLVYLFIAFLLLFGLIFLAAPVVRKFADMSEAVSMVSFATIVTGLWWCVLGIAFCRWPAIVQNAFKPFAEWFSRKYAIALACMGLGLVVLIVGVVACLRIVFGVF